MKHSYYQKYIISEVPIETFNTMLVSLKKKNFRLISACMKSVNGVECMDIVADKETFWDESTFDYNTMEELNGR